MEIELLGKKIDVACPNPERLALLVSEVNDLLLEVSNQHKGVSLLKIALLANLILQDKVSTLQDQIKSLESITIDGSPQDSLEHLKKENDELKQMLLRLTNTMNEFTFKLENYKRK